MSHDPLEIIIISWFGAQEAFHILYYIIVIIENSCAAQYFFGNHDMFLTL